MGPLSAEFLQAKDSRTLNLLFFLQLFMSTNKTWLIVSANKSPDRSWPKTLKLFDWIISLTLVPPNEVHLRSSKSTLKLQEKFRLRGGSNWLCLVKLQLVCIFQALHVNLTEKQQGGLYLWPFLTSTNLHGQYPPSDAKAVASTTSHDMRGVTGFQHVIGIYWHIRYCTKSHTILI